MSHSSKKTNADASCAYHTMHLSPTYYQQMGQHSNWITKRMDTREYVYTNKQLATPSTVQSARWDDNTNTSGKIRQPTKHSYVSTGWMDRRRMSQTIISARPLKGQQQHYNICSTEESQSNKLTHTLYASTGHAL
jgi:hypothetical protein